MSSEASASDQRAILQQVRFWIQLGGTDIASRYRRSVLGAFWIVLINSLTIIAIGVVYSSLFGMEIATYFPFLVVGYIFWLWMSATLTEMTSALSAYRYILINNAVEPTAVFSRIFARNFLILLHNLPIVVTVLLLYGSSHGFEALLFFPNFCLVAAIIFFGSGILAFIAARYQDFQHLIVASVGVLFLITPIIWSPDILTERAYIASINPLTHMMELLRAPLLGGAPNGVNYAVCLILLALSVIGFVQMHRRCRTQFMFWI